MNKVELLLYSYNYNQEKFTFLIPSQLQIFLTLKIFAYQKFCSNFVCMFQIRIRMDLHNRRPPGSRSGSTWTDVDPDPGGDKLRKKKKKRERKEREKKRKKKTVNILQ